MKQPEKKKRKIFGYYYSQEFINNKYHHLLMVLIFLFLFAPILDSFNITISFSGLIFFLSIIFTLRVVIEEKKILYSISSLTALAFITIVLVRYRVISGKTYIPLLVIAITIFIICLLYSIWILMKRLLTEKKIKVDTIEGGICIYILIGLAWALLYYLTHILDKSAFMIRDSLIVDFKAFEYYSFTILTTLGLGDIIPVSRIAISLTTIEAVIGQMFVAVFIARLISVYVREKVNDDEEEDEAISSNS
ncbi:MAG: potassium channel family protein [Candidatus Eremiobacteraeota bacterium]|nr:potassium channel family protein [Candidatus Eremiobacteraeota bacterium]